MQSFGSCPRPIVPDDVNRSCKMSLPRGCGLSELVWHLRCLAHVPPRRFSGDELHRLLRRCQEKKEVSGLRLRVEPSP
jgi:hypothetical protein